MPLYRMVTLGEKEVLRIAGNAGTNAERMAKALSDRWRRALPKDQKYIDVHQLQLCVRDDLHRQRREIHVIEQEHLAQLADDRLERGVRDVAIPQLRGRLVGIQRLFDGAFGAGSSSGVFGDETVTIPRDPFPLLRLGHLAHERLTDPAFVLPESELVGVKLTPRSLAKSFEEPLATLDAALVGLDEKLPATNVSLAEKTRKLDELKTQVGIAARFLEALYHLAGFSDLAQRVRPSTHRARNTAADPGVEAGERATEEAVAEEAVEVSDVGGPVSPVGPARPAATPVGEFADQDAVKAAA